MTQPSYHAIEWHAPPDLSTREVRSFSCRADRDAFVREAPRGGTEFRLAVSSVEARSVKQRAATASAQASQPSGPLPLPPQLDHAP